MHRFALASIVGCLLASTTSAQPLADRIPADAIAYLGWRGTSSLGSDYDATHTRAVVEASNLPALFSQFLPDLIRKVRTKDRDAADALDAISAVGGPLWRHPSAMYFGGVDMSDPKQPRPRFALLCDAGEESPQLLARLRTLIDKARDVPFALSATNQGNLVVFSTFDITPAPDSSLAANKPFTEALSQVQPKEALATAYIDGEGLLQLIDLLVNAGGDPEAIRNWPKARAASGLEGMRRIAWTCGFDGADFSSRGFIDAPAPRKGLLALLEGQPLADEFLKAIPKSATLVAAGTFDLTRALAEVRAFVGAVDAEAAQNLEKGLAAGSMMLGANIEKDLLEPLGSQWATYCAPTVGGNGLLGLALVNRLDDPAKAERSLGLLEMLANNMIAAQTRKQKDPPRIAFRTTKTAETTVHYLAIPFVAPAWTVRGQNLYAALFPQVVTSASAQGSAADSILDNETFNKARARVGGEQAGGVQFLDLEKVGADGYAAVLAYVRLGTGMADVLGVPAPPMVLPPLEKLQPHFGPVMAVTRSDERGFYYRKVSPFPLAENFGEQNQAVYGYNAMMMSVLLPSMNRARKAADRRANAATRAYYSDDDGKTWFADDINKVPPFDHNGKPAYRVYVYQCPNGMQFVSHLERYTPEGKRAMEQAIADPNSPVNVEDVLLNGLEVKDPGTDPVKGWVRQSDSARASKIMELKCPDGNEQGIMPAVPD